MRPSCSQHTAHPYEVPQGSLHHAHQYWGSEHIKGSCHHVPQHLPLLRPWRQRTCTNESQINPRRRTMSPSTCAGV